MKERQINDKRNWKAMVFPYDDFIPDTSKECQYCLTDKQAELLRGLLLPVGWKTRWWSDGDVSQDAIEAFRDDLIRRLMMSCCGDETPIQYQYTSDGVLQRSQDGGVTWEDAPQFDPRNNSTRFPYIPTDAIDQKCLAADSAVQLIKSQVGAQLTDDMTRYTLGQLINDWTKIYIQSSNPFEALATVVTNQIFALLISALRPALTDDVYDKLRCVIWNAMASDFSFNTAQWTTARSQTTAKISGIAGVFLEHLIYLVGPVGLTNLVRAGAGSVDADCAHCDDTCPIEWDWQSGMTDVVKIDGNHYTMTTTGVGHFSFSSGNVSEGCYWNIPLFFESSSIWPIGSMSPVPGTNAKTTRIWNFDTGVLGAGEHITIEFSDSPFT